MEKWEKNIHIFGRKRAFYQQQPDKIVDETEPIKSAEVKLNFVRDQFSTYADDKIVQNF